MFVSVGTHTHKQGKKKRKKRARKKRKKEKSLFAHAILALTDGNFGWERKKERVCSHTWSFKGVCVLASIWAFVMCAHSRNTRVRTHGCEGACAWLCLSTGSRPRRLRLLKLLQSRKEIYESIFPKEVVKNELFENLYCSPFLRVKQT